MALRKKIQELIQNNKINPALEEMKGWADYKRDVELTNMLIILQSQYNGMRKLDSTSQVTTTEAFTTYSRITSALLDILNENAFDDIPPPEDADGVDPDPPVPEQERGTILFLASNPTDTGKLQLEKEFVRISQSLQEGEIDYKLVVEFAVQPGELQQALIKHKPNIIHFSGHGEASSREKRFGGIVLQNAEGKAQLVSGPALAELFRLLSGLFTIDVVLLNACYSEEQGQAIVEHVPYVVGMNTAIPDNSAIEFSKGFYTGLAANGDVPFAFGMARSQIMLEGLGDEEVPVLLGSRK